MQNLTWFTKARLRAICGVLGLAGTCVLQSGCRTFIKVPSLASVQTLPLPKAYSVGSAANPTAYEKQFRTDTGETEFTRRVEFQRQMRLPTQGQVRLSFKYDLSAWPDALRPLARLWVAVGAASALSAEGPLGVGLAQNGVGMTTQINNTFDVDGTMLMGSDFALADGEVIVEIDRLGHVPGTACTVHAIVYIPKRSELTAGR